jgi:hypothetical protein
MTVGRQSEGDYDVNQHRSILASQWCQYLGSLAVELNVGWVSQPLRRAPRSAKRAFSNRTFRFFPEGSVPFHISRALCFIREALVAKPLHARASKTYLWLVLSMPRHLRRS